MCVECGCEVAVEPEGSDKPEENEDQEQVPQESPVA